MRTRRSLNLDRMLHGRRQRSNHSHRTPGARQCHPVSTKLSGLPATTRLRSPQPSRSPAAPMLVCAPWAKHRALLASLTPTEATRCRPLGPGVTRGHWPVGPHGFAPPRLPSPQRPRRASTHPATPLPCPAPGPAASPPRALCFPGGGCRPGVSSIPVSDTGGSRQTAGAAAPPPGTAGGGGGGARRLCRLPPAGPLPSCTLLLVRTQAPPSRAALPPSTPAQWDSRREPRGPQHPARRRPLGTRRPRQHTALALFQHTDVHAHVTSH